MAKQIFQGVKEAHGNYARHTISKDSLIGYSLVEFVYLILTLLKDSEFSKKVKQIRFEVFN